MEGGKATCGPAQIVGNADSASRLCARELRCQNDAYHGTGDVSRNNRSAGFFPAYLNAATGETAISRFADGRPAPVHVLDGLPAAWVRERDASGGVRQAVDAVVAGFVRNGVFYTREQAARRLAEESPGG